VQGLFEKSDSIGYDAIYQYKCLCGANESSSNVLIFAEKFEPKLHPTLSVGTYDAFLSSCKDNPDTTIIYHFCDGWPNLERFLTDWPGRLVVRWHNNTPPWFYATTNSRATLRTIAGFRRIIALAERPRTHVWANSEFSRRQLLNLVSTPTPTHVVY